MAYRGACQVWTEGVTVRRLCDICRPGRRGRCSPLAGRLCGSFVLCVYASFLLLPLFLKVLGVACCIHSRRLPSCLQSARGRMLRHATASLLFVLLRCNCVGWSCCVWGVQEVRPDALWQKLIVFSLSYFTFSLAICSCTHHHHHPSIHPCMHVLRCSCNLVCDTFVDSSSNSSD